MVRYETLLLTTPEITNDEAKKLEKDFDKLVRDQKGSIISFERWGKFNLAYPVRRADYGVYYLVRFEVMDEKKQALLDALRTLFTVKLVDLVMRNVIVRLDKDASLEYNRPESLEETPSKDIDLLVKESKELLKAGQPEVEEVKEQA